MPQFPKKKSISKFRYFYRMQLRLSGWRMLPFAPGCCPRQWSFVVTFNEYKLRARRGGDAAGRAALRFRLPDSLTTLKLHTVVSTVDGRMGALDQTFKTF